jgi:lipid II:glycine glycyltransferase (peptidoglycan interpeptide bridge formation enzyme)
MNQHFLQSDAWEKFQHALGNTTVRREGDGWSYLAIVERGGGLTRLYCPYGPTVTSPAALNSALESLAQEAKARGAAFLRVQPQGYLLDTEESAALHMKPIAYSQPVATRVINLSPSLNDIIAAISQSKRSVIRNYQK